MARPGSWRLVRPGPTVLLTAFLWHVTAITVGAGVARAAGAPEPAIGSGLWWALRPAWLVWLLPFLAAAGVGFRALRGPPGRARPIADHPVADGRGRLRRLRRGDRHPGVRGDRVLPLRPRGRRAHPHVHLQPPAGPDPRGAGGAVLWALGWQPPAAAAPGGGRGAALPGDGGAAAGRLRRRPGGWGWTISPPGRTWWWGRRRWWPWWWGRWRAAAGRLGSGGDARGPAPEMAKTLSGRPGAGDRHPEAGQAGVPCGGSRSDWTGSGRWRHPRE